MSYKKTLLIIFIALIIAAFVFAVAYSLVIRKAGLDKPVKREPTLEERAARMRELLEETNRQINASSTLRDALNKRGAEMQKTLTEVNKEINASSTLKDSLNERGAEMLKLLEEANKR